ncbi:hypothetical protein CBER1_10449 [Cercospora berteroae]|uniref:Uncharacterized protein n=1 Tax=Cercospora berteroae TaxID=357750 RepID=A0A2S6CGD9_9PEZI|nr:hypothetical protein CBER1_10449 [Cercospora berteroae]
MDRIQRKMLLSRPRWQALFRNAGFERSLPESAATEEQSHQAINVQSGAPSAETARPTTYVETATQTSFCTSDSIESSDTTHATAPVEFTSISPVQNGMDEASRPLEEHTPHPQDTILHNDGPTDTTMPGYGPSDRQKDTEISLGITGPVEAASEDARHALAYIFFVNEEEEDYTTGPVRVVIASDGIKEDASALLSTLDFSAKVRKAVLAQRSFRNCEVASLQQSSNLRNLEMDIETEIDAYEYRLDKDGAQTPENEKLAQQLSNMQILLEDVGLRQRKNESQLRTQAKVLRTCQTNALNVMEEAFVVAGLVPELVEGQEANEEPYDLQTEYQNFMRDLEPNSEENSQLESSHSVAMLELAGPDFMQSAPPPLSPEAQQKLDAKEAFYEARQKLVEAQVRFDRKEEDQAQARHEEQQTEDDEEKAAFDLHWFQRNREITRELIEAEEQLAKAKAEALALGVEIRLEDQASGFSVGEDEEEGAPDIRESWEGEATAAHFSRTKVDDWLGTVDEQSSSEQIGDADTDDWDAQEVEISESRSLVAWGPPRKKIDKWQQDCTRLS